MRRRQGIGLGAVVSFGLLVVGCQEGGRSDTVGVARDAQAAPVVSIHDPANRCLHIVQEERGVALSQTGDVYALAELGEAAGFYFKPSRLGAYLLLSDYSREAGMPGSKSLLGISDPAGEFLDATGNFVGEVGILVSAVGDIADLVLDPIAPLGQAVRNVGDNVGLIGDRIGDVTVSPALALVNEANDLSVWRLLPAAQGGFQLINDVTGQYLAVAEEQLGLTLPERADMNSVWQLVPAENCAAYPEVDLNLRLVDERGPALFMKDVPLFSRSGMAQAIDNDDVYGYIDAHSHVTAYEFIGGRVNYGDPFHKFGVDHALDDCAVHHGPQGTTGVVESFTTQGLPVGVHDTQGWPSFGYWPTHNSLQHHQSYYRWIERAYYGGLRILVNHYTGNEILCQLNPQKENDCDFEANWRLQRQRLYEMQDYIDAQSGGPGRGWFRIVDNPASAREVIAEGKLAVVQGIEISKLFNCGEFLGQSECTREQITQRLDAAYDLGVRHIFPVHKFDNALGGVVPDEAFGIGTVLYAGNLAETGHLVEFEACPENFESDSASDPDAANPLGIVDQLLFQLEYIDGQLQRSPLALPPLLPASENGLCNIRGLSPLGDHLVTELMRRGMIIEVDHSSRKAIDRMLEMAEANGYPGLTSSHDWLYSEELLDRVVANDGTISRFASSRASWVDKLNKVGERPASLRIGELASTGMASDVNGIASLPGNSHTDSQGLLYPFLSVDGRVEFDAQVTGDRRFDLYDGNGVAHYGLYPDQIADMAQFTEDRSPEEVRQALQRLFSSAETYLRNWEAAQSWRQR